VHIVTGRTAQGIEIDALVLETRVLVDLPAVAAPAGRQLSILVPDRIGFRVDGVATGTIDGPPIVRTADKLDGRLSCALPRMANQAGMQLLFPGRCAGTAAK